MPPTQTEPTILDKLYEQRLPLVEDLAAKIAAHDEKRSQLETRAADADEAKRPTDEERDAFTADQAAHDAFCDQREAELNDLDKRINQQNEIVRRRKEAADASKPGALEGVQSEPLTYRQDNGRGMEGISYYRDLACVIVDGATFGTTSRSQSLERLTRHAMEMDVEVPKRVEKREKAAREKAALAESRGRSSEATYDPFHRGATYNPVEKRVEPNRTDGYGGYFIPPLWLPDQYIPALRAHLVAAGLCRQLDLPAGTDSINIPKIANTTAVGYQVADASGVVSQDWSDTYVQANVKTLAGQSDVALQLLEQSPNGITDEVITTDLMAAYNQVLDQQVIYGNGANTTALGGGAIQGIYNGAGGSAWTGYNGVTWTATSRYGYSFQQVLGAMASQIAHTRFDAESFKIVMHGRRFFWYTTSLDGNDRPLGETVKGGPFNVAALIEGGLQAEGLVGTLPSVADAPVYIDNNIGTTDTTGGGSTSDYAIAALWDDLWLFQGDLRTNVFREVLSGTLGVRFQLHNYIAFLARYGQSLAIATGSGFTAPTGSVDSSIVF